MDATNVAAALGFSRAAGASVPEVIFVVSQYQKELQTFAFIVHALSWPGATRTSSRTLTVQIDTLVTYSSTVSSVTPTTLDGWLLTFHVLALRVQSADNALRGEIGIPTTTSYP
jgi:hypothetical protein